MDILEALAKSKFRNSFHLKKNDIDYIDKNGLDKIEEHANDFIKKRLASCTNPKDGNQTPFKGHPVFIAEHATATCCRSCLFKWHKIDNEHDLTEEEINYVVNIIMKWIKKEYRAKKERL